MLHVPSGVPGRPSARRASGNANASHWTALADQRPTRSARSLTSSSLGPAPGFQEHLLIVKKTWRLAASRPAIPARGDALCRQNQAPLSPRSSRAAPPSTLDASGKNQDPDSRTDGSSGATLAVAPRGPAAQRAEGDLPPPGFTAGDTRNVWRDQPIDAELRGFPQARLRSLATRQSACFVSPLMLRLATRAVFMKVSEARPAFHLPRIGHLSLP